MVRWNPDEQTDVDGVARGMCVSVRGVEAETRHSGKPCLRNTCRDTILDTHPAGTMTQPLPDARHGIDSVCA